VDIFLNQTVPVSVISADHNPNDDDDDDTNDESPGPSPSKRLRMLSVLDQIIAGAITNAFTQVNNTKVLSGCLIPCFGCTLDHVMVFMYDPKNDVLLQLTRGLTIWGAPKEILIRSVVHIWMVLNFTVFMQRNIANECRFHRSNFHHLSGNLLKGYWNLQPGMGFSTGFNFNDVYSDVLLDAYRFGKNMSKR
jgi:hypothetical protein